MSERKMIYLCLAHMSEEGVEQKYVKEAFDTNWVVPMGPNVNAFEEDLRNFVSGMKNEELRISHAEGFYGFASLDFLKKEVALFEVQPFFLRIVGSVGV